MRHPMEYCLLRTPEVVRSLTRDIADRMGSSPEHVQKRYLGRVIEQCESGHRCGTCVCVFNRDAARTIGAGEYLHPLRPDDEQVAALAAMFGASETLVRQFVESSNEHCLDVQRSPLEQKERCDHRVLPEANAWTRQMRGQKFAPSTTVNGNVCVVCCQVCGDLKGLAKSWACAGKLSRSSVLARRMASRFDNDGKRRARDLVLEYVLCRCPDNGVVLDLWGGGSSARLLTETFKSVGYAAVVVSAESRRELWPAMRADALRHGYDAHCGPVEQLPGPFDFIWLDLCGQLSRHMETTVKAAAQMLRAGNGFLAITVMPERERDAWIARSRVSSIPAALRLWTGLHPQVVLRYDRGNGHEMYLVLLDGSPGDDLAMASALNEHGEWFHPHCKGLLEDLASVRKLRRDGILTEAA